jgi:hypothetical protein
MQLQAQNEVGEKKRQEVREISQFHDNMGQYCMHNKKNQGKKKGLNIMFKISNTGRQNGCTRGHAFWQMP